MIQSFFVPAEKSSVNYVFFDTVYNGKHVFTACGVGRIHKKSDAQITPTAQQTLEAVAGYAERQGALSTIRLHEIATLPAVTMRIRKGLESANEKDVVFFVCRDHHIYDAAVVALNVNWKPDGSMQ